MVSRPQFIYTTTSAIRLATYTYCSVARCIYSISMPLNSNSLQIGRMYLYILQCNLSRKNICVGDGFISAYNFPFKSTDTSLVSFHPNSRFAFCYAVELKPLKHLSMIKYFLNP